MSFIFLALSLLSVWIKRTPYIWGSLLALSVIFGIEAGLVHASGLFYLLLLALLWGLYAKDRGVLLFSAIVALGTCFKLKLIPGFSPHLITPKFMLGLQSPVVGLFPLALAVPLARGLDDIKPILKGLGLGILGIGVLAILATFSGAIKGDLTLPTHFPLRLLVNLIFTCIPEEAFYRGFIQNTLSRYFGNILALLLTSALFTLAHAFWAPNPAILAFTFIASLLYGSVYLTSKRIESSILTHFLLNLFHMVFFNYSF